LIHLKVKIIYMKLNFMVFVNYFIKHYRYKISEINNNPNSEIEILNLFMVKKSIRECDVIKLRKDIFKISFQYK